MTTLEVGLLVLFGAVIGIGVASIFLIGWYMPTREAQAAADADARARAERLKAGIVEAKTRREAELAKSVESIENAAEGERQRDPVDVANDLIRGGR